MVDRCEGLPLAIVAIANVLAQKERREPLWKCFHDNLTWTIEENTSLQVVPKSLSLSIWDLPLPLRNCLFHCAIFPEDYLIRRSRLTRLWVAEGFVKATAQRTMEEVAEDYLSQLARRCLLQVVDNNESTGRISSCRLHKLVRELLLVASSDERFAQVFDGRPEDLRCGVRRLSITGVRVKDDFEDLGRMMELIRSLHLFPPASASTSFLSRCKLLQVLDLCDAPLESLPEEFGSFFNLRYLSLRRTSIRRLPSSVENLSKLETLDAVHSNIEELPNGVGKLKHLRHLMAKKFHRRTSRFTNLDGAARVPGGIGGLKVLQTLKAVVANETMIRHLRGMTQMRSLDIRGVTTILSVELAASVSKMEHLLRLVVMANYKDDTLLLSGLTPPPGLRRLNLYGRLHKGLPPPWFGSLQNLTHLVLKMSKLKAQAVPSLLALLPNLESLFLMQAFDGERLSFPAGSLCKLRSLGLCDMVHLSCVEVEATALEQLHELTLVRCHELRAIPRGIERLTRLQKVELEDMPLELVEELREWPGKAAIKSWRSQANGRWDEEEVGLF